jgi:CMP/dCMP kinase
MDRPVQGRVPSRSVWQKRYGVHHLDTGAMYRAVGLKAIRENVDIHHEAQVKNILETLNLKIDFREGIQRTYIDGEDVTGKIRTDELSQKASDVAALLPVRLHLVELQRRFAKENPCVMDGRDIGTFVLPDADVKFYVTASIEERANRRLMEYRKEGQEVHLEQIKQRIKERDAKDEEREIAPLRKAEDAILIDTSGLGLDEVLEKIESYL